MGGGGSYVGAGWSLTADLSILPYTDIGDFAGSTANFGGSIGFAGLSAGGEINVPTSGKCFNTFSLGLESEGTLLEGHVFYTHTTVQRLFH
jgi:hypothetical protein